MGKVALWQVNCKGICAGFTMDENGTVINCAPILRKRLEWWKTIAKEVIL